MCYRSFHFPEFLSPDVRSGVVMWCRPGPISCQETKEDTLNRVSTVASETRLSDVSQEDPRPHRPVHPVLTRDKNQAETGRLRRWMQG